MFDLEQVVFVFEAGFFQLYFGIFQCIDLPAVSASREATCSCRCRVRQHDQRLSGLDLGAVLNEHLLHGAALVGGEIPRGEGRGRAAHGDEVFEWTFRDLPKSQIVDGHPVAVTAECRAQPKTSNC
jgi:hypothetical protein